FDARFALHAPKAPQYETVCRALLGEPPLSADATPWRDVLRTYGVGVVVLYDTDAQRLFGAVDRLALTHREWSLLQIDGRPVVFGWKPGLTAASLERLEFDPKRLAFGEDTGKRALPA